MSPIPEWDRIYEQLKAVYPGRLPRVTIEVTPKLRKEPRNFADVLLGRRLVEMRVHPEILSPPLSRLRGVLSHEAGHILSYLLGEDGYENLCRETELPWYKDEELRADQLAEIITGDHIYYDEQDLVQRAGSGAKGLLKRPRYL